MVIVLDRCFSDIEGNSTIKRIYTLSFLVGKHHDPQSINGKLYIPIGIVAYNGQPRPL